MNSDKSATRSGLVGRNLTVLDLKTSCRALSASVRWTKTICRRSRAAQPIRNFTIAAEIHARSLAKFYGQYADRHMNLKFVRRVSTREREIRQFVIVKNKLMSVFNVPVLLLTINFVKTLTK